MSPTKNINNNPILNETENEFLYETALGFVKLNENDNIYQYIAERIKLLFEDSYILVHSFSPDQNLAKTESIVGFSDNLNKVASLLGFNPMGALYPINEKYKEALLEQNLLKIEGGFHQASFEKIPKTVSQIIENAFSIKKLYSIGLSVQSILYGTILIVLRGKDRIDNERIIKTLAHISAVALQRRQALIAQRESEKKYKNIFENIRDIYYETYFSGKISIISPSFYELIKYAPEETRKTTLYDFYADPKERDELLKRIKEKGFVKDYEINLKDKYDNTIPCSISSNVIYNEKGEPYKICGSLRDISERKKAEETLKKSERELRKAVKTKDKFFSIIAHDLRSPLTGFTGLVGIIKSEFDKLTQDEIKELLDTLLESANNLYQLLENLLEWSKIQRDAKKFEPQTIHLSECVNEVSNLFSPKIQEKSLELNIDIPTEHKVISDANTIKTIMRNLVSNAIKFTHHGGKIAIYSEETEDNRIAISVKDSGVGIKQDRLDKIFKLEEKAATESADGEKGSGIGLSLTKELIEQSGGEIWAESELDRGSTFTFTLPKNKD